ncbi:MAG: hypothetical protein WA061_02110 [Microgenomates group bacterium]
MKKVFSIRFLSPDAQIHLEYFWHNQEFITWLVAENNDPVSDSLLKNGGVVNEVVIISKNA